MKRVLMFALFAFSVTYVFAQQDQKAKSILENVTKTTQSYTSIQATFDYVMENEEVDIHEEYKGSITMKGEKYNLKLPQLGLDIYSDGSNVWTYMVDAGEVTVSSIDEDSEELMNPSTIFTIYEEGFDFKYIEETMIDGKSIYVIDLFPTTDEIEYERIRIQIDKQKMLIKKAEMFSEEGNCYIINVIDFETNVDVDDSSFIFDVANNANVDVIDLR